jgi:hypothetical protein
METQSAGGARRRRAASLFAAAGAVIGACLLLGIVLIAVPGITRDAVSPGGVTPVRPVLES